MSLQRLQHQMEAIRHRLPAREEYMSYEEWIELRAVILEALKPYVDARVALAQALMEYEQTKHHSLQ